MKKNILWIVKMTAIYSFWGIILQAAIVNLLFASSPSEGQNLRDVKLSVKATNVTFNEALKIIEQKTDFKFNYIEDEIPINENVTISVTDESLYNILEVFANDYGLIFNRINNQITIKKAKGGETEKITAVAETGSVRGRVTDANTKEPLIGANIVLKGTTIGATTDANGYYSFENLKPGTYTIVVKYVGFSAKSETVVIQENKTIELNISLAQGVYNLDEVVVTGSITERSIKESANPITIITTKDLEYRNLSSLSSVFQSVPGIVLSSRSDIQNQARIASFGGRTMNNVENIINIRGYTSSSAGGSPFKVILDGVELADISMINYLDPNQIERIEIARGPMASTLYGAGSSSGVLQIFTKRGLGNLNVNFRTMYTSKESKYQDSNPLNSEYSLSVRGNKGETNYNLGIDYLHTPISRYNFNNGINGQDWSINAGVNSKIGSLNTDLKAQYNQNESGAYDANYIYGALMKEQNWQVLATSPYKVYILPSLTDYLQKINGYVTSLNLRHIINDNLFQNLSVGYSRSNYTTIYNTPNVASDASNYYMLQESSSQSISAKYFINLKLPVMDNFKIEMTGGIDQNSRKASNATNSYKAKYNDNASLPVNSKGIFSRSNSTSETSALFAETILNYYEQMFMTVGFRSEKNNSYGDDTGWYNMPRVGLTYVTSYGDFTFKPRVSWGKSTQAVSPVYKNTSISVYGPYSFLRLANPDLKPQSQVGWEYGLDMFMASNVSVSFTYFNQQVQDIIQLVYFTDPNYYEVSQYVNISKASNKGWEVGAKVLYEDFALDLSLTSITSKYGAGFPTTAQTTDPELREGGRILGIPSNSFVAKLSYSIPSILSWTQKGGSIAVEYVYNGNEYNSDGIALIKTAIETGKISYQYKEFPGYSIVNLRGSYSIINNLDLFFDIRNILNNQIILNSGPMSGRTISFGFNVKY